jgi:hypothetical protein
MNLFGGSCADPYVEQPEDLELASRLSAALGSPTPPLPPETDAFLAGAARLAARRIAVRRRRRVLVAVAPVAAAAALALTFVARGPHDAHDVNGDGKFDILDAFALARRLDRGEAPRPEWDFNDDRHVDRADVDWAAHAVVRVK